MLFKLIGVIEYDFIWIKQHNVDCTSHFFKENEIKISIRDETELKHPSSAKPIII